VLAVVAHPDDEVIACGAMLAFHARRGDEVTVVHATDGAAGDPGGKFADIAALRSAEGRRALAELSVRSVEGWGLPDGGLASSRELVDRVRDVFRRVAPGTLYSFTPLEFHPDHVAVAEAVIAAGSDLPAGCACLLFGVNHQALPGVLMDTSDLLEVKRRALACFGTQLAYNDFLARALARDHAATVNIELPGVTHAEAFVEMPPAALPEFGRSLAPLIRFLAGLRT
jgi:LmbE family N-acetylglucosaminyl deacetylase